MTEKDKASTDQPLDEAALEQVSGGTDSQDGSDLLIVNNGDGSDFARGGSGNDVLLGGRGND